MARIQNHQIQVVLPNPMKVPDLMEEFWKWLNGPGDLHPVELAAEAHYQLVTIHPFADGNGRTARLLMNLILIFHGYPPAIIRKRDRLAYLTALEEAQFGGAKDDYQSLISKAANRSLDIYLKVIDGDAADETSHEDKLLKIGQLARAVTETVPTIRFWTKEGLRAVTGTTASNYALYSTETISRIRRIQSLKKQRLTIKEIRKKLDRE